jgi:hypothetical protein
MAIRLAFPSEERLGDLALIRDLGAERIQAIVDKLAKLEPPPLRPDDVAGALAEVLDDRKQDANSIVSFLISFYALQRQRRISPEDVWGGLTAALKAVVGEHVWSTGDIENWERLRPHVIALLSIDKVALVIKALDLEYDYQNLLRRVRILTDIRPVFNSAASEIRGAIVTFTLRLSYDSPEAEESHGLEISLDEKDIRILKDECERALAKAKSAEDYLKKSKVEAFISGENRNE